MVDDFLQKKAWVESELISRLNMAEKFLDVAGVMLISLDVNQCVSFINPKGCEILGYSREKVVGKNWFDHFLAIEGVEEVKSVFNRIIAGDFEPVEYYENPIKRKDGTQRHIAWHNSVLRDNDGSILGIFSSGEDITDRVEAERRETFAVRQLQLAMERAREGTWEFNTRTGLIKYNEGALRMLDYPVDFPARSIDWWLEQINPDHMDSINEHFLRFLAGEAEYDVEFQLKDRHGEYIWVTSAADVVEFDDNNRPLTVLGIHRDITKRKEIELSLKASEERFELAMAATNDGLYDMHLNNREIYLSPGWKRMLGYEDHELENHVSVFETLTNTDDLRAAWQMLEDHLAGKCDRYEIELRMQHKEGHWVDILSRATAVLDDQGNPIRIVGTHQDITERKRAEKEKRALELQVQHSQKMEAVATLAGGIAHDFNNMLAVIIGNTSNIVSACDCAQEFNDDLADIMRAAKQAQGLTQQLLTFAKGGAPIKKVMQLNELIKDAVTLVMRGTKCKCQFQLAADLWAAEIDQGQFNQVINNVAINANQAMPDGGLLKINTWNEQVDSHPLIKVQPGKYVVIAIEDEGNGIPESDLEKVFDPFFTTKETGSGLGLTTTYSVIKNHNGYIVIDSEVDRGTQFKLYLPASSQLDRDLERKTQVQHTGSGNILIMDDDLHIRRMLQKMLSKMGYQTVVAVDGEEALKLFGEAMKNHERFDFAILDLTIPGGMGGAEVVLELLKLDPGLKALVSSGYSNDPIMANFRKYGFTGVIPKPYTRAQLAAILNELQRH